MKRVQLFVPAILFFTSCYDSENSYRNSISHEQTSYQETKLTLEQQEQQRPVSFLRANGTYRQNLIGEWVLEGNIQSSASVARFKDPVLTIVYQSETGTEIGREDYPIYKFIGPGETLPFKIKRNGYQGTSTIGYEVTNAQPIL